MMGYGVFFWLPSFFVRSYGLTLLECVVILRRGVADRRIGRHLGRRLAGGPLRTDEPSQYREDPGFRFFASVPFYVLAILSPTLTIGFLVLLVPTALGLVWLGPVISTIQHVVRPDMRATASAIFLFINNLIGIGIGTYAIGALSDTACRAVWRRIPAILDPRRNRFLYHCGGAVFTGVALA